MFPHVRHSPRSQPRQAGFSLVEIMVGMVIGLIGVVIMMQVFQMAETQKRASTGGSDAQTGGAIAMSAMARDIRQGGYGYMTLKTLGCALTLPSGVTLNALAPVTINSSAIPAGDANTDTLLIMYGNSDSSPQGDMTVTSPSSTTQYPMTVAPSFNVGDYVIALPWGSDQKPSSSSNPTTRPSQGTACSLRLVQVTARTNTTITVDNPVSSGVIGSQSFVYNLGPRPQFMAYAVRNGNLTVCKFMDVGNTGKDCSDASLKDDTTVWIPVASNIVSLRAQYGRIGSTMYNQTTPPLQTAAASPTTRCSWANVVSIRVALVARSAQYDRNILTAAAPTWAGSATSPTLPISLTSNPDWQHYRYKVFQTVVPVRNTSWIDSSEMALSC